MNLVSTTTTTKTLLLFPQAWMTIEIKINLTWHVFWQIEINEKRVKCLIKVKFILRIGIICGVCSLVGWWVCACVCVLCEDGSKRNFLFCRLMMSILMWSPENVPRQKKDFVFLFFPFSRTKIYKVLSLSVKHYWTKRRRRRKPYWFDIVLALFISFVAVCVKNWIDSFWSKRLEATIRRVVTNMVILIAGSSCLCCWYLLNNQLVASIDKWTTLVVDDWC